MAVKEIVLANIDPAVVEALAEIEEVPVVIKIEEEINSEAGAALESIEDPLELQYFEESDVYAGELNQEQLDAIGNISGIVVEKQREFSITLSSSAPAVNATKVWPIVINGQNITGKNQTVCVVDTGINYSHAALGGCFGSGCRVLNGYDFVNSDADPMDDNNPGHGTHVAGIAAGNAQTPAGGGRIVSGVAPRAYIGNYKVFVETDTGLSPNANSPAIVAAIEAAVADGMDVINFSGGEPEIEPSRDIVALALDAAAAAGVVPVISAGNDYTDVGAGSVSSPANSARALAVGAVEISGNPVRREHAEFSSVGPTTISLQLKPDVAAPGVDVLSSVPEGWGSFSGTSMAAPHVAGAAALLAQRHPEWTVAEIKSALVQTGSDSVDESGDLVPPSFQGGGVIALARADRPQLFAEPTALSLGLLARRSTASGTIRLDDAGGGAGTWQITDTPAAISSAGGALVLPPTVDVPGALSYELVVPAGARLGDLTGYIELRRGSDLRRVPYWGRVSVAALQRHTTLALRRPGSYKSSTAGRPALVSSYRYPDDPRGIGVTTVLRGPERVYRILLTKNVANLGVVITERGPGSRVEPRIVALLDENRLAGYAGLPVAHNPYLEDFRSDVLAAGALSPIPGEYAVVFDSASRAGAGSFTFRYWVNDVTPPTLRVRSHAVPSGRPVQVAARDSGSGVYPDSIVATIDGKQVPTVFRRGVVTVSTRRFARGTHRLRLRVSDYQESKNTENVAPILPNTRTLVTTIRLR